MRKQQETKTAINVWLVRNSSKFECKIILKVIKGVFGLAWSLLNQIHCQKSGISTKQIQQ